MGGFASGRLIDWRDGWRVDCAVGWVDSTGEMLGRLTAMAVRWAWTGAELAVLWAVLWIVCLFVIRAEAASRAVLWVVLAIGLRRGSVETCGCSTAGRWDVWLASRLLC